MSEQTFDIVIIGAGPSAIGCLCGLIECYAQSGDKELPFHIAVLEKGIGPPHDKSTKDISNWFNTAHRTSSSCEVFSSTPQKHLNGRIIDIPCGIGYGGGTNVNACLIRKPLWEFDFQKWPGRFQSKTYRMKDAILHLEKMLKDNNAFVEHKPCESFLNACNGENNTSTSHCCDTSHPSILHTSEILENQSQKRSILTEESSSKTHEYMRSINMAVVPQRSKSHSTEVFHRVNYFDAILSPLLSKYPKIKSAITFLNGTLAQRIIFQNNIATGVVCQQYHLPNDSYNHNNNKTSYNEKPTFVINASKQIILCTGAIISPALLMVSGLGNAQQLQKAGITNIVQHLPKVGENLRDHIIIPRSFLTPYQRRIQKSLNSLQGYYLLQEELLHHNSNTTVQYRRDEEIFHYEIVFNDGHLVSDLAPHFIASLFRRDYSIPFTFMPPLIFLSNIFFYIIKHTLRFLLRFICKSTNITATANIHLLNPQSTGSVSIVSTSTITKAKQFLSMMDIKIDPNYFSHPLDLDMLSQGWKSMDTVRKHHFQACIELLPGPFRILSCLGMKKDDAENHLPESWLLHYAKEFACPYYHWCGTCQMGQKRAFISKDDIDESFVVTETLAVQGVQNLRICDASVFPTIVSCPTALTCSGLGYVFGQMLAEEFMKESKEV